MKLNYAKIDRVGQSLGCSATFSTKEFVFTNIHFHTKVTMFYYLLNANVAGMEEELRDGEALNVHADDLEMQNFHQRNGRGDPSQVKIQIRPL